MIENIAIAASVISAITAVTTSLRALGRSREFHRDDMESRIKTGSRDSNYEAALGKSRSRDILLHLIVTIIWTLLSVACASPLWIRRLSTGTDNSLFAWILFYLILVVVLCLIWFKVFRQRH